MSARMRNLAWAVADSIGIPWLMRRRHRQHVLILMYHAIVDDDAPFERWTHVRRADFAWQIDYLRRRYRVLPLRDVIDAIRCDGELPDNVAVVTFDDGTESVHSRAFPILQRMQVPATVFLTTSFIGTDHLPCSARIFLALRSTRHESLDLRDLGLGLYRFSTPAERDAVADYLRQHAKNIPVTDKQVLVPAIEQRLEITPGTYPDYAREFRLMDWAQVQELHDSRLIDFGAHGSHHLILSQLPDELMRRQVLDSCAEVRRRLGIDDVTFAYPNGRRQDFGDNVKDVLQQASVHCGLSTIEGLCTRGDDLFELKRIGIGSDVSKSRFAALCSGLETGSKRRLGRL